MTSAEWDACNSPHEMLDYLEAGGASKRKLRHFSVACCRRLEPFFVDPRPRLLMEVSERYADGLASGEELLEAGLPINILGEEAVRPGEDQLDLTDALRAVGYLANTEYPLGFERVLRAVGSRMRENEENYQSNLLRDIFGNPLQPPPAIDPSWLAWNDGVVGKMARLIYDDRRFGDLPLLADALEDAGYEDADVLSHCRRPGEHVRGCWVVDLLLGKE